MSQVEPHYYSEINYLRGLAILSVISIHVSGYFTKMTTINLLTILYMAIDALSQVAIPAFIFISGFVLYNNYSTKLIINQYYIKRFKSIIPQYIIFSTFYIIAAVYGSKIIGKPLNLGISDILYKYFTGEASYHLWFFVLIFQLYILYPVIFKIYNNLEAKNKVSLFLLATFVLGIIYLNLSDYNIFLFRKALLFVGYLFYFVLGIFTRSNYEFIRLKSFSRNYTFCISACISVILCIGTLLRIFTYTNTYFSYNLFIFDPIFEQGWKILLNTISILYNTTIFILMLHISIYLSKSKKLSFIDKIGSYSFAIYLLHVIILYLLVLLFSGMNFNWNNLLFYPSVFILTLILSILTTKILKQIPHSEYIIGKIK
jgi:probable poly-beta-1,6-N-acetyl-D-glucosamine export protein